MVTLFLITLASFSFLINKILYCNSNNFENDTNLGRNLCVYVEEKYYKDLCYLSTKLLYFDSKMIHHIAGLIKLTNYIHHVNYLSIINLFNRADIQSKESFFHTKLYRNVQSIKHGELLSHDPIICVSR